MLKRSAIPFACFVMLFWRSAWAEPVYDFVRNCKEEEISRCYDEIDRRLGSLNNAAPRRICLPQTFGATLSGNTPVPVSVIEHVRLALSAARFGSAGRDVDDEITEIVGKIYPCN